jgi:NAD(P)-binding Rossmann-like domain
VHEIETDYLVIGAGASGMAFVDALVAESDAEAVLVDRRHRPGGHWLDAYPFVRLHQPSAYYGVDSRVLGADRIDGSGPNAGFYERATAAEICDYFTRVLEEDLVGAGRVRFFGMSDYGGEDADGHHFTSLLTGAEKTVRVRRKVVDATYVESTIPSRHTPTFEVGDGVRLIPPNDLVDLTVPATGYTVIGAGKTAMDTCTWLLDAAVDPGAIRWVRPRDGWLIDRAFMQPLELVGSYMQLQARWVEAAADASDGTDFAHRLEAAGVFVRIDPDVEPTVFRGATISAAELDALRQVDQVVRLGKVLGIGTDRVVLDQGTIATEPGHVYVDCTAAGVPPTSARPVFEPDRITIQYTTVGLVPYGAATIGAVEALGDGEADRNRLCPPVPFSGEASGLLRTAQAAMTGLAARGADPAVGSWDDRSRLNPARGARDRLEDPRVAEAYTSLASNIGPAMANLERRLGTAASPPG